jgi:luciferase family oxidoreductase group 1
MIPFSVLDLSPIAEGATASDAFRNTLEYARRAEALGYHRFWLAEHHNMTGVGSAATAVVIGHVAGGTTTIRVGSGGIMLPNHSPLVIAEQFGTLAALHPGRIDLGLGRAPGSDMLTMRALRRDMNSAERFPQDVQELLAYFEPARPGQRIQAVPGAGAAVEVWLLGSSTYSAQLAALLGLPFAFAAHFSPPAMMPAITAYRERFEPSARLDRPHVMLTVNALAADTDEAARYQFTAQQQAFLNLHRGNPGQVPAPVAEIGWTREERRGVDEALAYSFVGSPDTVASGLKQFVAATRPDELMVTAHIHNQAARLRSLELLSAVREQLGELGSSAAA